MTHIRVHLSIRVIYLRGKLLMRVELYDGIEKIKVGAFLQCTSLCKILIPPSVRAIKAWAFFGCLGLTTAILNDGLEDIGADAFYECTSLVCIMIPPFVTVIDDMAFGGRSGLRTVTLGNGLEEIGRGHLLNARP